jgi:lysophospholipase L1-like esterase
MTKEDLKLMRWIWLGIGIIAILLIYSIWNLGNPPTQTARNIAKKDTQRINISKEAEFLTADKLSEVDIVDTSRQHILFIGDSMADGLRHFLQIYAQNNNHKFTVIAKTSTSIVYWVGRDSTGRLRNTIEQYKPTYVMICLGSNDLFTRYLDQFDKYLDNILHQLGNKKFIWICPPNWKDDFGLTDLIEKKVGEDRFFPSKRMKIPRAGDHIHPTYQGYKLWADSIANWTMNLSRHKIILEKPKPASAEANM